MTSSSAGFFRFTIWHLLVAILVVAAFFAGRASNGQRRRSENADARLISEYQQQLSEAQKSIQDYSEVLARLTGTGTRSSFDVRHEVKDGVVILVRKGDQFGGFVLKKQRREPEFAEFDWWMWPDKFDASQSGPSRGSGKCVASESTPAFIEFGLFSVRWSGPHLQPTGYGAVYYGQDPGSPIRQSDVLICFTDVEDISAINPRDPKWIYVGNPNESGMRGDQSVTAQKVKRYPM